jgi:hypothetical protein
MRAQSDPSNTVTGWANVSLGLDHRLEQMPAMVLILEGSDQVRNGCDPA